MRDLTPGILSAWVAALEKSLPVRIQGIHAVNVPIVVEWVFSVIKSLAKQKISQRVCWQNNSTMGDIMMADPAENGIEFEIIQPKSLYRYSYIAKQPDF